MLLLEDDFEDVLRPTDDPLPDLEAVEDPVPDRMPDPIFDPMLEPTFGDDPVFEPVPEPVLDLLLMFDPVPDPDEDAIRESVDDLPALDLLEEDDGRRSELPLLDFGLADDPTIEPTALLIRPTTDFLSGSLNQLWSYACLRVIRLRGSVMSMPLIRDFKLLLMSRASTI